MTHPLHLIILIALFPLAIGAEAGDEAEPDTTAGSGDEDATHRGTLAFGFGERRVEGRATRPRC